MTLRDALGVDARHVYERVDEVLDSEDGIILLVDRRHATSYLQGFALSGCQIELLSVELERAVRALAPGQWAGDRRTCHDEPDEGQADHRSHGPESERWPRVANGRSRVRLVAGNPRRRLRVGAGRLFRMAGEVSAGDPE